MWERVLMERDVTRLKIAVVTSGRRQKDIAAALGMSEAQFSLIVNGKNVDHATQERIAAELGQSVTDVFPTGTPHDVPGTTTGQEAPTTGRAGGEAQGTADPPRSPGSRHPFHGGRS